MIRSLPLKVSVVVPVYNPGEHIDLLVASLRRQSLPAGEFQAIFVDDGSDDGTADRLDRMAQESPNFRVIHIPNSGWPGKPRNVGLAAAEGEYVQFADHDDELGDEALERMYDYAVANDSDVLVGKEVRRNVRRHVPPMFATNRPRAVVGVDPLLSYLTPHKMFRREFLAKHGIRFPEGPRRLEDHPFVMKAYFAADVVSVLADYPCYFWIQRSDRGNAGLRPREWSEWFGHLRDVLDVVEANTEPGPVRDGLLSHWYRTKGLSLLGPSLANRTPDEQTKLVGALRELTLERYPETVDDHVPGVMRVAASLLRAGDLAALLELSRAQQGMGLEQRLESVREEHGQLVFTVAVTVTYGDGSPVVLQAGDGARTWRPPFAVPDTVPAERLDFTACSGSGKVAVVLRHRRSHEMLTLPGTVEPWEPDDDGVVPLGGVCTARLDPEAVCYGSPLGDGPWDLDLQVSLCGFSLRSAVRGSAAVSAPIRAVHGSRLVSPYVTVNDAVAIDVDQQIRPLVKGLAPDVGAARLVRSGGRVELVLPWPDVAFAGPPMPATLRLVAESGAAVVQQHASVAAGSTGATALACSFRPARGGQGGVPHGRWRVSVRIGRRLTNLDVHLDVTHLGVVTLGRDDGTARVVSRPGRADVPAMAAAAAHRAVHVARGVVRRARRKLRR